MTSRRLWKLALMPLDPVFESLLQTMAPPDITRMTAADARAAMHPMFLAMGARDVPIGKVADITAPGPAGPIAMRIYTPVAVGAVSPGIAFFHGGGFVIGSLDVYDAMCRILANESGARVVSVDYRLAPEHPFPAAVDDAFAALKWVEANAAALGIDANALAVAGDSAGGNLAAAVSQLARKGGPRIAFQLLIYPWLTSVEETESMRQLGEGYFLDRAVMNWFGRHYIPHGTDLRDPRLSPLHADDLAGLPPAYIVTAGYDPLKDEGAAYARRLKDAGVEATHVEYAGMIHGFVSMGGIVPLGNEALAAAARACRDALAKA
jgi:acetyl esterase